MGSSFGGPFGVFSDCSDSARVFTKILGTLRHFGQSTRRFGVICQQTSGLAKNGAGEGNRTLISGLGSPHSTTEPHPLPPSFLTDHFQVCNKRNSHVPTKRNYPNLSIYCHPLRRSLSEQINHYHEYPIK